MKKDNAPPRRRPERARRAAAPQAAADSPLGFSFVGNTSPGQWGIIVALFIAMTFLLLSFGLGTYEGLLPRVFATVVAPLALAGIIWAAGLVTGTFVTVALIFFLFTPYTHQLDEIKNLTLMSLPPVLLLAAAWRVDFSRFSWRTHASSILLGVFVGFTILSYLVNLRFWLVGERVMWFQTACITFTLVFAWFMSSEMEMRRVMIFFVIVCFFSAVVGLVLFAGQDFTGWLGSVMEAMNRGSRSPFWSPQALNLMRTLSQAREMYSTILNSDFYAAFLVMTIWLPLAMFFIEDHVGYKVFGLVTFLLMLVCLAFTNSNDSYFAFGVLGVGTFALLSWRHIREWVSRRLLVTFLVGAAVLGVTLLILMIPTLDRGWDFKTEAYAGRKVLWGGGFWPWLYGADHTASRLNPLTILFGTGPGGYRFYFPVFRSPDYFDNQINNVTTFGHNWYLDVLLEFGAFGLLAFLAFHIRVVVDAWRQIHTTTNRAHMLYQIALVTGLVSIAFQNFFSPNNRWAVCGMIYWTMFGLSMGVHHLDNPGIAADVRDRVSKLPRILRNALLALAVLFAVRSIPQARRYFEAAMANGMGLIYMEYAEGREGADRLRLLTMASDNFEKAIRLNPTFATSYYKLGHVYNTLAGFDPEGTKMLEKAVNVYETLHRINPHYSEVHLNLGIMYLTLAKDQTDPQAQLRMMERSYEEIREAARQAYKPQIQNIAGAIGRQLARVYEVEANDASLGEDVRAAHARRAKEVLEETKGYYRTIITYEPKLEVQQQDRRKYYDDAHDQLVSLARRTGSPQEAADVLRKIYEEDPEQTSVLDTLTRLMDEMGQAREKFDLLEDAVHGAPLDVGLRKRLARAYFTAGRMADYIRELRRIEVLAPEDTEVLSDLLLAAKQVRDDNATAEYAGKLEKAGGAPDGVTTWTLPQTRPDAAMMTPTLTYSVPGSEDDPGTETE